MADRDIELGVGAGLLALIGIVVYESRRKKQSTNTTGTPRAIGTQPGSGSVGSGTPAPARLRFVGVPVSPVGTISLSGSQRFTLAVLIANDGGTAATVSVRARIPNLGSGPSFEWYVDDQNSPNFGKAAADVKTIGPGQTATFRFATTWSGNGGSYRTAVTWGVNGGTQHTDYGPSFTIVPASSSGGLITVTV